MYKIKKQLETGAGRNMRKCGKPCYRIFKFAMDSSLDREVILV